MVIQHNMQAMNASRMCGNVSDLKSKSMKKLSSGYKINTAADDAAGLTISEKMRWQIRGMNQASENVQDGISLIQVAEGALSETQSILQRMNELSTQAANDTNTSVDREAIQAELDQLTTELDRVANTTNFNAEIYPLKGGYKLPDVITSRTMTVVNNSGFDIDFNGNTYANGTSFDVEGVLAIGDGSAQIFYKSGSFGAGSVSGNVCDIPPSASKPSLFVYKLDDVKVDGNGYIYYENTWSANSKYYALQTSFSSISNNPTEEQLIANGARKVEIFQKDINLQSGALANQKITVPTIDASAKSMGISNLDVSSFDTAGAAMKKVQSAVDKVSTWRSTYGAIQNRLEHTYNNLQNTSENTQSAESRIRDTDMADEMQKLSTVNILESASNSMLAQANSSLQNVLALLQ